MATLPTFGGIDGYIVEELATDVFAMVPTRRKNTRRVAEALRDGLMTYKVR
jgi:hypothetical protein